MTDRERLLQLAEFVADGVPIDWVAQRERLGPEDRTTLERLATLDGLNRTMRDPAPPGPPDLQSWGHLKILGRIGQGATSTVFRAFDPALDREVALKLRSGRDADERALRAWTDEARRLARIRHPNVLAVHGAGVHDGIPGLWCDLLSGKTLEPGFESGEYSVAEILSMTTALLEAVICVHDAGLIHGDIKPANVIREPDGRVVLMDFGAASEQAAGQAVVDRAGTPIAMAPERFEGQPSTPAIDIFGVGIVLFVLLEGRYPVLGTTEAAIRGRWRRGDRPAVRNGRAPRALRKLVLAMLASDPTSRPTASDSLASLRRIAEAPRRRGRTVIVAAAFSVLSGALAVSLSALQSSRQATAENEAVRGFLTDVLAAPRRTRLGPGVPMGAMLEDSARIAPVQLSAQPAALADVLITIGDSLVQLDRAERGRELFDQAAALLAELDRPIVTARLRYSLARLASEERRFEDAEALYRQNIDALSPTAETLSIRVSSWVGLGRLASERGELDAAEAAFDRALTEALDLAGESSESVALTQLYMGQLDLQLSRYDSALSRIEASVNHYLARSGPRNRNVLAGRSSMVEALDRLGRLGEAAELAETNAAVAVEWLGADDRFSLAALDALSNIQSRRGRPGRALEVSREALRGLKARTDPPVETVLHFESNQVGYLLDLDRPREALMMAEQLMPRMLETLGAGHSLVEMTALNLADALLAVGRPVEALAVARDLYRRFEAQLGEGHLFTLVSAYLTGASLSRMGESSSAAAYLERAHDGLVEQLGQRNSLSLKAAEFLAEHRLRAGQADQVAALVERAHALALEALGPDHLRTRRLGALRQRADPSVVAE